MAKPFGLDSAASNSKTASQQDHLLSWLDESESVSDIAVVGQASDSNIANLSLGNTSSSDAGQAWMKDLMASKRERYRKAILDEEPGARAEAASSRAGEQKNGEHVPQLSFIESQPAMLQKSERFETATTFTPTNLELTGNTKEVPQQRIEAKPQPEQLVDLSFATLKQLEGPYSASSQWMMGCRPDLFTEFQSEDCALQFGSQPDGTVFKIFTSANGNSWAMTAKGSTTVEIIADRSGRELFKLSGRNTNKETVGVA